MPKAKNIKWEKGARKGIRFYKHETRKHGVKFDRYYSGSYQVNGKRKFMGFGWSSKGWDEKVVERKLDYYKENAKAGKGPTTLKEELAFLQKEQENLRKAEAEQEKKNRTFGDFFEKMYVPAALRHKKKYTVDNEESIYKNWIESEIGHLSFNKIKPFNLEKIKKNLLDGGKAPRTVQYCFAVVRQVWNQAKIDEMVFEDSPTKKVKIPKVENKRERFLSQKEATALLGKIKKTSQQTHDITLFSLHTGVRAGEIFSLTWGVVDLDNGSILIRDAKGKPRHVYLTSETQNIFQNLYQNQNPNEFVFKDKFGKKIKGISNTFDRAVSDLGLNNGVTDRRDKVIFHTCRHTFASWHVQNGTDLYTVKELLGHSTIQLTERYSHLRPEGLKIATKKFDEKIRKEKVLDINEAKKG